NNQFTNLIDKVAEKGFDRASEAFEESAFLNADGLLFGLFGILILLATSFLVAIGGAFILLAKIALILLAGLGPFFIIALLWQPTYRFFEQWIGQVLSYTILIVLLATM
ncbi:type IV secretion system protein, partial [Bartonella quintana]